MSEKKSLIDRAKIEIMADHYDDLEDLSSQELERRFQAYNQELERKNLQPKNSFLYLVMKESLSNSYDDLKGISYDELKRRFDAQAKARNEREAIEARNAEIVWWAVVVGIITFLYWIGLYYSSLLVLGLSVWIFIYALVDQSVSKPGDWVSWAYLPFSALLAVVGTVMYLFSR